MTAPARCDDCGSEYGLNASDGVPLCWGCYQRRDDPGVPSATPPSVPASGTPSKDPMNAGDSGCQRVGTPGTPPKLRILDVQAMATTEPEPVDWAVQPLLAAGCVTLLAGREGTGKSMLALGVAAAVGHGADLAGMSCQPGRVLYVDAENGEREAHRRIRGLGVIPTGLTYLEAANGFTLRTDMPLLSAQVKTHKPTVLVLDSFRSLAMGLDENDSASAEAVLRPLVRLAQTRNIAVLLLHHASRASGEYRGSTAIGAAVEMGYTLARNPEDPETRTRRRLHCWKCRPAAEPDDVWLTLTAEQGRIHIGATTPYSAKTAVREDASDALMAALNGKPVSFADWARAANLDPKGGTTRRARDSLVKAGRIRRVGMLWEAKDGADVLPFPGPAHQPASAIYGDDPDGGPA